MLKTLVFLMLLPLPLWPRTYSTTFPATEDPLSDGGQWIDGGTTGVDWHDVQTSGQARFRAASCNAWHWQEPCCMRRAYFYSMNRMQGLTMKELCSLKRCYGSMQTRAVQHCSPHIILSEP